MFKINNINSSVQIFFKLGQIFELTNPPPPPLFSNWFENLPNEIEIGIFTNSINQDNKGENSSSNSKDLIKIKRSVHVIRSDSFIKK